MFLGWFPVVCSKLELIKREKYEFYFRIHVDTAFKSPYSMHACLSHCNKMLLNIHLFSL